MELKSVTEALDRSTPLCKLSTTLVMGMAEMFSDVLGTHFKRGVLGASSVATFSCPEIPVEMTVEYRARRISSSKGGRNAAVGSVIRV